MVWNENLLEAAIAGKEVPAISIVAKAEGLRPNALLKQVASGRVIIMQTDGKQRLGVVPSTRIQVRKFSEEMEK